MRLMALSLSCGPHIPHMALTVTDQPVTQPVPVPGPVPGYSARAARAGRLRLPALPARPAAAMAAGPATVRLSTSINN